MNIPDEILNKLKKECRSSHEPFDFDIKEYKDGIYFLYIRTIERVNECS